MTELEEDIIANLDNWSIRENIFYSLPIDHILCGYWISKGESYRLFAKVCIPICDKIDSNLVKFGAMLFGGGALARSTSAVEFAKKAAPHRRQLATFSQPEAFAKRYKWRLEDYRPLSRRRYATVLILLGRYEEAIGELEQSIQDAPHETYTNDTRTLLAALSKDPDSALRLIHAWEAETKRKFDLR